MFAKIKNSQQAITHFFGQMRDLRVVGLMVFLAILLLVSWSGVKAIETNYGLQKQISKLQQENDLKKLANENLVLGNKYYETSQYLEIAARQDFGLAAPGETVLSVPRAVALKQTIDLPKPTLTVDETAAKQSRFQRNFQAWMDFLLHRNKDTQ